MDHSYASGAAIYRGNVTAVQQWLDTGPSDSITYQKYDVAGNVIQKFDALGNATKIEYDSNNSTYAFATRITNALGHAALIAYDTNIGKPIAITDANSKVTNFDYSDPLDR